MEVTVDVCTTELMINSVSYSDEFAIQLCFASMHDMISGSVVTVVYLGKEVVLKGIVVPLVYIAEVESGKIVSPAMTAR